jgi:hypothetical protein
MPADKFRRIFSKTLKDRKNWSKNALTADRVGFGN